MKEMTVDKVIQMYKRMGEKMWTSYYVEAFHEPVAERLTCLEGDDCDRVDVPCLVFLEQVTKLVDWCFLEYGRRGGETAVNIRACLQSSPVCETDKDLILKSTLFQISRAFDTLPFDS